MTRLAARAVVLAQLAALAAAGGIYAHGEIVSMVLRTQHAGWRSPWSDALRAQMPRFGVAGSASLAPPLPRAGGLQAGEPLKLSLAFADSQVVVPWLPVVDGDGSVLTALTLTFVCDHEAGDTIYRVKWDGEYAEPPEPPPGADGGRAAEPERAPPAALEPVVLKYEWEQTLERDLFGALVGLFVGSLALAALLACRLCDDGGGDAPAGEHRAGARALDDRARRRSHED